MDDEVKTQLFGKLDKISDDIVEIKVTLGRQESSIGYHIKRTDLLEEKVELLKEDISKSKGAKDSLVFMAKIGSFLVAIAGLAIALVKRFSQ
jgi:hypothetical protein